MNDSPVNLDAVDTFIAARRKGLSFPDWLERQLELDTRSRRAQRLRSEVPVIAIIYNLYLLPDWLLVGDRISISLLLHFAVVTPWILLTKWVTKDDSSRLLREGLAGSIPVAIVLQILVSFLLTSSVNADHYQYFVLLVLLFANTVQRMPFKYSCVVSGIIIVCHALAIALSDSLTGPAALVAITTLWVAAYLTLTSNYFLERDSRRTYLHTLRDKLRHAEIEVTANHDALTNLANRHHLSKHLQALWNNRSPTISHVAMIMIDVDHFKLFNDHYGHSGGDVCLKRIAACVKAALRNDNGLAVRYGGEELLVLLPGTEAADAIRVAERIRCSIEGLGILHEAVGADKVVTVSCGVASGPPSTISALELVAAADAALYAAKRNGRNQVWPQLPSGFSIAVQHLTVVERRRV